jgi:hypothetical protein
VESIEVKLREQLILFFDTKFKECDEINKDLNYLSSVLQEYR